MPPTSTDTDAPGMFDRYVQFLGKQYVRDDGKTAQHASSKFITALRELHAVSKPGLDVGAHLAGTKPGFSGRVWFWSDLHFFHTNVISYCERPFEDSESMNATMIRNCLETVAAGDLLIFGGDVTMGNVAATNDLLRSIPAYKLNVVGNHDMVRKNGKLHDLAVDERVPCLEFSANGQDFFVSHYPVSETVLRPGQINLHGHIHNQVVHPSLGTGARHLNMSVEHTGYRPVSLQALQNLHASRSR